MLEALILSERIIAHLAQCPDCCLS